MNYEPCSLAIWGDTQIRHAALDAILAAWLNEEETALQIALQRVDTAVVEELHALGLERGPVAAVDLRYEAASWLGRKEANCNLVFNAWPVELLLQDRRQHLRERPACAPSHRPQQPDQSLEGRTAMTLPITAAEYITRMQSLVTEGSFAQARAFDSQHSRTILPRLTTDQLIVVTSIMDVVSRVTDSGDADADRAQSALALSDRREETS